MKWLSVIDEDDADTAELSSLPSLQRLIERMESQKARVLHNEAASRAEEGGYTAEDEVGRQRLLSLCREFLTQQTSRGTLQEVLHHEIGELVEQNPGTMWNRIPVGTK